jgi:hypothetical protein
MKKILVSLLSDNPIPNVLVIKKELDIDLHFFISTEKMQRKKTEEYIIKASQISKDKLKTIIVNENNIVDVNEKLSKETLWKDAKILVNITGGTKLMSLGAYEFFNNNYDVEFLYIDIKDNNYHLIKNNSQVASYLQVQLTLNEYLATYGITINNSKSINKYLDIDYSNFLNTFSDLKESQKNILATLRENRNSNSLKVSEVKGLNDFLNNLSYEHNDILKNKDIKFLTGEWLEHYIYQKIKEYTGIRDEFIGNGVQFSLADTTRIDDNVPNEIDVLMVKGNTLYLIECKTSIFINEDYEKETNILRKTLDDLFVKIKNTGLRFNAYLFTLSDLSQIKAIEKHKSRAKLYGIDIVDKDILLNKEKFDMFLQKIFK